ncbi:hypothetical protein M426DRAFT_46756, partial [Hypoxylon sp. CI-4A]
HYEYQDDLNSTIGQIRVLEILSSSQDDHIECRLEVCDIHEHGIPEALSYVWGRDESKLPIVVDQKPFFVGKNLYKILKGLRRRDATRKIWVDAICINQSNSEEKTHQVRIMREIYSKAKNTTIWLSGSDVAYE